MAPSFGLACAISWVLIIQTGYHHHMVASLRCASYSSGAIFRTKKRACAISWVLIIQTDYRHGGAIELCHLLQVAPSSGPKKLSMCKLLSLDHPDWLWSSSHGGATSDANSSCGAIFRTKNWSTCNFLNLYHPDWLSSSSHGDATDLFQLFKWLHLPD